MVFIFTQYLQKLSVQSVSQPRHQELPAQCKSPGLCWRLILPTSQTMTCRISHQLNSAGVRSDVVGATSWSIFSTSLMRDMGSPNTVSKQCRCLITHKTQTMLLSTVHPPVLLQLSCLCNETAVKMFREILLTLGEKYNISVVTVHNEEHDIWYDCVTQIHTLLIKLLASHTVIFIYSTLYILHAKWPLHLKAV